MATVRILRQRDAMPSKIQAIKLVRSVTNMGLKEAKDAVELLPTEFEVSSYTSQSPESVVSELRGYGYDSEIVGSSSLDVEETFKTFLIALINSGEYDQVVTFIKTKRSGVVAGGAQRRLEI